MEFIKKNYLLLLLIIIYTAILLSILDFGIPNPSHPFTYHMDEWHQLMSVRALFKYGSSNVLGAANGPIFFFLLVGIYLAPLYVLRIIDPFVIKSSVGQLVAQQHLYEVLRLNSVLFGIGCIVLVWFIAKRFLKVSPFLATFLFIFTPTWIMLSNTFKYDIALLFFQLLSLYFLFLFAEKPSRKRFILTGIFIGCDLAIKISALPLLIPYLLAYFLSVQKKKWQIRDLMWGFGAMVLTFCLVGIPDMVTHYKAYYDFFYLNIVSSPHETANYLLPFPVGIYMSFIIYPVLFGHAQYYVFLIALGIFGYLFLSKKYIWKNRTAFLLLCTTIVFIISLVQLQILAGNNRALVLAPFIAFFPALLWKEIKAKRHILWYWGGFIIVVVMCLVQLLETYGWLQMKYEPNPRQQASVWMVRHLPKGTTVGIENIPIYQGIPDIALKEFYTLQQDPKAKTHFSYQVVDAKSKNLPATVIITNGAYEQEMLKTSPKKDLLVRLQKDHYRKVQQFDLSWNVYKYFGKPHDLPIVGLILVYPISIYQK